MDTRKQAPYVTKDGSQIRELMHPRIHGNRAQNLAEATVHPGGRTLLHRLHVTEEPYHITAGEGLMTLGSERFVAEVGDTVCIPPGTPPYCIEALGVAPLRLLCCCAPPYDHDDTEIIGGGPHYESQPRQDGNPGAEVGGTLIVGQGLVRIIRK